MTQRSFRAECRGSERSPRRPSRRRSEHARAVVAGVALGAAAMSVTSLGHAQQFPFPSSNVTNGQRTGVLTSHELRALYDFWRGAFIEQCGADARMRYPESNNDTRSEGVGYGMVIAAYFGDRPTFDGLWNYYQRFQQNGLMRWRTNGCNGSNDSGSAADADVDAAFGLIVADRQWPNQGYNGDAVQLLGAIRTQLFEGGCQGILLAGSDANFSNCGCTNPSYMPPAYYRSYAAVDTANAAFWNNARTATYTYLANAQVDNTGLVPAWANSQGGTNLSNCNPQVSGGGSPAQFQADAARTPWRVATDYVWTGNAQAQSFLTSMAGFIASPPNRTVQIVDVYSLQGTPLGPGGMGNLNPATLDATGRRSTFTMGGFATAMTASSQENLDRFTGAWQSMYLPGDSIDGNHAFNTSLALLYGLVVTGYMWDPTPGAPNPTAQPEPPLVDQPGNLLDNGDFDQGFSNWTIENFGAGASEAYAMHKDGELVVQIEENQAEEPWNIPLYQFVNVQQGTNYLISFKARSTEARPIRVIIENLANPAAPYGQLINRFEDSEVVTIDGEMRTYETVFTSTGTDAQARFSFQLGGSAAPVILDDVSFTVTDRPPSFRGELIGQEPPIVGGGGDGSGAGDGSGDGDLGAPSGPSVPGEVVPPGAVPGGQVGQPPAPGGAPPVTQGGPQSDADCASPTCACRFDVTLRMCYDVNTGYVYNAAVGQWQQPPVTDQCAPYYYWPRIQGCYDPATGYGYNSMTGAWQYVGQNFTIDTGEDDSGCSVVRSPSASMTGWGVAGGLGLAALTAWRRRRRAKA